VYNCHDTITFTKTMTEIDLKIQLYLYHVPVHVITERHIIQLIRFH
jgi:hypothetical protein